MEERMREGRLVKVKLVSAITFRGFFVSRSN
jgi:hypothetical protein